MFAIRPVFVLGHLMLTMQARPKKMRMTLKKRDKKSIEKLSIGATQLGRQKLGSRPDRERSVLSDERTVKLIFRFFLITFYLLNKQKFV